MTLYVSRKRKKAFYVWKALESSKGGYGRYAILKIPTDAICILDKDKDGKCRANKAKVVSVVQINERYSEHGYVTQTMRHITKARACYDNSFVYEVGKIVKPSNNFDASTSECCRAGIHFYRHDVPHYYDEPFRKHWEEVTKGKKRGKTR